MVFVAVLALVLLGLVATIVVVHLVVSVINSYTSALPVSTPNDVIPEVLAALRLPEKGEFIEPGCGDGRMLTAVLHDQPGIKAIGIDNNPAMLAVAHLKLRGRAKLALGDLLKQDFTGSSRVFTYLSVRMMEELEDKFKSELPRGARLVSLQFPLPERKADQEIALVNGKPHAGKLYIYDY